LLLNLLKIQDKDGRTVLHYAAEERNIEKINKLFFSLLPNDSSSLFELLKIQDNFGHTVLHYETIFSNKDLFLPILDKISEDQLFELLKIQSNQEFIKGFTILHLYSFGCDNNDIILALMNKISKEKLSELSKIEDAYGNTFLHYFKDHEDILLSIHDKIGQDS